MLSLAGVAKLYGPRLIFKDINLEVKPASVTLLAGSNGAGKSTLLKIIAGLASPSAGKIVRSERCSGIGYLGHQTFIYPDLTALENLAFWGKIHRVDKRGRNENSLLQILQRMELASFAHDRAGSFSRGMTQRLNLARLLLLAPDLLLLDEPATGLDLDSMSFLYREIFAAKERGAAIVWISHNLKDDLVHADKVAFLKNKRLSYYGEADKFQLQPNNVDASSECVELPC